MYEVNGGVKHALNSVAEALAALEEAWQGDKSTRTLSGGSPALAATS